MKAALLLVVFSLATFIVTAQSDPIILRADINHNAITDVLRTTDSSLQMRIDGKSIQLGFDRLGFEEISQLSFKKNILTIRGGNDGTGAFTWTYKFRHNTKTNEIELIGFDSFSKWISGSITKSINLLTWQYEILLENYNHQTDQMEQKRLPVKSSNSTLYLHKYRLGLSITSMKSAVNGPHNNRAELKNMISCNVVSLSLCGSLIHPNFLF